MARSADQQGRAVILGTPGVGPVTPDLIDAFTQIVESHADRTAVVHNGRPLSYLQLDGLVQRAALRLGAGPGVVGVRTSRSPGVVAELLGVLAAGGTYCPVDPAFPAARQRAMVAAAGCHLVIDAETVPQGKSGVEPVDFTDLLTPRGTDGPDEPDGPQAPAYILFTSGSTGDPKPVVTPRGAITTVVGALRELFDLGPADRVLQFASLNWDTCFEEILPTLTAGAALVLDDEAHSGSFPRLLRMVERERITVLDLPTAYWHELVRHLTEDRAALPPSVRLVVIGGEAADPARLADWCALATGDVRLVNTYGSTETTLITHAVDLHGPRALALGRPWRPGDRVPIGLPLPHVLERIGAEGELMIGGPALALGYRGLPQATEARFGSGEDRWFRTGDRVERAPGGVLLHRGRLDGELKIRGIRVDPAEVEAHLTAHPQVAGAAVTGARLAGRTTLVAYVVPAPGADTAALAAGLRRHLTARVPGHLVPGRIALVERLARTSSGKLDRAGTHRHYEGRTPEETELTQRRQGAAAAEEEGNDGR
ncbi:amino acid adenylation domain-containing protein [Kitasatospora sp. MBT63]|uniref:amino acid adenylation domain-containing protein n=1 Tax=Kitasatospora sp. MBT63 TaxID=1444768 RepID=UPI0009E76341|nr:amino acid adenylation domain-containing protein [Kitasatospora sp. MBT63]